jgi:hypothetical protein
MTLGRKTGGRKKGSKNRITRMKEDLVTAQKMGRTPIEFLCSVYESPAVPIGMRIHAAEIAAPYCHLRLSEEPQPVRNKGLFQPRASDGAKLVGGDGAAPNGHDQAPTIEHDPLEAELNAWKRAKEQA